MYPLDSKDPEQLIKLADDAMYLAKQSGKNSYMFYRDVMQKRHGE
jgi:PleD family two-component response regulator